MIETDGEKIKVLVVTSRVKDLSPVAQFLNKRQYDISLKSTLRESIANVVGNRPDWVFVSINLGPLVDKFTALLKTSFGIEPIMFGDILDRNTMSRLSQLSGYVLHSKLTGPSIQLKIHQIMNNLEASGAVKHRMPPRATSGVKKSSFGHIMLKGNGKPEAQNGIQHMGNAGSGLDLGATTQTDIDGVLDDTTQTDSAGDFAAMAAAAALQSQAAVDRPPATLNPSPAAEHTPGTVESVHVVVNAKKGESGYTVMDSRGVGTKLNAKELQGQVLGPIEAGADSDTAQWDDLRAKLVRKKVPGVGETLSCFVPDPEPLPEFAQSPGDVNKVEVRLQDIPVEVPLPCALYVYLPQNQKYVCLLKGGAVLTLTQQQRLTKLGLKVMVLSKDDIDSFSLFFVREKLARGLAGFHKTA